MSRCDRCGCVIGESEGAFPVCAGCLLASAAGRNSAGPSDDSFGDYEIICEIGEGGMGVVYLAEQNRAVHREVALKALKPGVDTAAVLRRFEAERQVLALMEHPNIATFHDAGASSRGRPYFVMEFVDGLPITTACDRHACTIPERLTLFAQVCRAIEHAHRKGVVHRDIKPSNILVTERDSRLIPKVIDFGIARALTGHLSGHTVATVFGELLGTPEYMSPEQAAFDSGAIGPASDIYSLGVLLYELLAGMLPLDPARLRECGITEAARIIREEEVPPPTVRLAQGGATNAIAEGRKTTPEILRRLLSRDLARILSACLQKEPRLRYASAAALADDIDRYLRGEPVLAQGPTVNYRARKWFRRHRNWLGSLAVAAAAAGFTLWISYHPAHPVTPPTIRPLTSYTGTELQPSFSPDGKRFAFAWDGGTGNFDVYTRQVEGGSPVRITTDPDLDLFPAWSPDGRMLAYFRVSLREKSLYVIPAIGGPARKITALSTPDLVQGGDVTLNDHKPGPAWSPDGKSIVVADSRGGGPDALYEYRIDRSGFRKLTAPNAESAGDLLPAFSTDGHFLAFVRNGSSRGNSSIYVLDPTRNRTRRILSEERNIWGLAWMSNQELLFSSNRTGRRMLWHISRQGGTPVPVLGAGREAGIISYSRAKGQVAFSEESSNTNVWRIRLGAARGTPQKLLFSSRNTESAEYSPNGDSIVFVSNRLGTRQIWLARADGSNSVQLSFVAPEVPIGTPRWSPDGRQIVYDTVSNHHSAIGIMNANGSQAHIVTNDPWDDMMPSWSHDGRWIYFSCKESGALEVCRKPAAGGATTLVTAEGGSDPRESPDGQFVFYARAKGIWRAPRNGGNAVPITPLSDVDCGRYWTVAGNAIYFLRSIEKPWIVYRYDLGTGKISSVAAIEKQPDFGSPGLTVSPDQTYLLFGQIDEHGSNIMLVEGVFPD
jgi:serine/threonine protein kinase/Tol biopolymer transport system component